MKVLHSWFLIELDLLFCMYSQLDVWPCWVVFTFTFPSSCRVAITLTSTLTLLHFVFVTTLSSPVAGLYFLHSSTTCWAPLPSILLRSLVPGSLVIRTFSLLFPQVSSFHFRKSIRVCSCSASCFYSALLDFRAKFFRSKFPEHSQKLACNSWNWIESFGNALTLVCKS